MKKLVSIGLLLLLWAGVSLSQQREVTASRSRVALVIGNGAYKSGVLANPVNDARSVSQKLKALGFTVLLRENLKIRELGAIYRDFRKAIPPGGEALVFYAGHGVQFRGQNYFPAVDSDISSEEDVPLQSLNLSSLLDNMEEAKAAVSIVLLDACRDNPFARKFRGGVRGLAKADAASGTLIHYATKPGSVADDGEGNNGTYTESLLAFMDKPGIPIELMLKKVTNQVVDKTSGKQEPWIEGSLRGDFFFRQPTLDQDFSTPKPAATLSPMEDSETLLWNEVKTSGNLDYLEAYLAQFGQGKFQALARIEIKKINDQSDRRKSREHAALIANAENTKSDHASPNQTKPNGVQTANEPKKDSTPAAFPTSDKSVVSTSPNSPPVAKEAEEEKNLTQRLDAAKLKRLTTRFQETANSVIDSETTLEWTKTDNGPDINWFDAQKFCDRKWGNWRLPTIIELTTLYDASESLTTSCGGFTCHTSDAFKLNSPLYWTSEREGMTSAWTVLLANGERKSLGTYGGRSLRALCVRRL